MYAKILFIKLIKNIFRQLTMAIKPLNKSVVSFHFYFTINTANFHLLVTRGMIKLYLVYDAVYDK